jgi:hypothetical protein
VVLSIVAFASVLPTELQSAAVAPMAVYLDARTRQGTMTLYNAGTRPEEIRVEFAFGYPQSDDQGNVTVPLTDEAPAGEPSAVPWLTAFPKRVVLEPGQRQVIRVVARPPAGLDTGEYWGRALIRSKGGVPPIESEQSGVAVQLEVETVVVVAVNYRNGEVNTGLEVKRASAVLEPDSAVATIDLERTGNAAFLGRLLVEALDEEGRVVGSTEDVLAVYRTMRRRVAVAVEAGATTARVRYTMDTEREDLPAGGVIPTPRVVHETVPR